MRMQQRAEAASPVDLSVRTVRRSADSTAWQVEADAEAEGVRASAAAAAPALAADEGCDSTAQPRPPPRPPPPPRPRRTAVMPRVHFMPAFNVEDFYQQRDHQDQHLHRRERPASQSPPQPQVSLPGVSTLTLPWPVPAISKGASSPAAGAAGAAGPAGALLSHSPLLPRFSSNRSSLYPSSSAPALPAHAADPTGYLQEAGAASASAASAAHLPLHALHGLPLSLPLFPPLAARPPQPQPPPAPPSRPLPLPDVTEVPGRIRTKAEMKMLGDAAAEAVRSWLATASPDPNEPVCEASTSGLGVCSADDCHLDSAEDIARGAGAARYSEGPGRARTVSPPVLVRAVPDDPPPRGHAPAAAARDPAAGPGPAPGVTATPTAASSMAPAPGLASTPAEGCAAPDAAAPVTALGSVLAQALTDVDVPSSSSPALEMPKLEAMVSASASRPPEPQGGSPSAPASAPVPTSALLKNLEESDDSQGAWAQSCLDFELQLGASDAKRKSRRRSPGPPPSPCDSGDKEVHRARNPSVSAGTPKSKPAPREVKSYKPASGSPLSGSKSRSQRDVKEEDSDSSEESDEDGVSSEEEEAQTSTKRVHNTRATRSSKVLPPDITSKKSPEKETQRKNNICTRSRSGGGDVMVKSPMKTRRSSPRDNSPGKKQVQIEVKKEPQTTEKSEVEKAVTSSNLEIESAEDASHPVPHNVRIRLRTKIVEVERAYSLRPKGDGSDFRPGWEEEVFQYKRSLRMPHVLINISKGSINSEGACSKSPSVCSASESVPDNSQLKRLSRSNSEIDIFSSCPDIESEDALSSNSLPASVIGRRSKPSILDHLVEKVSRVNAGKNKSDGAKPNEIFAGKTLKSINVDKSKIKQQNIKNVPALPGDMKGRVDDLVKVQDSIKSVFGMEKVVPTKKQSKVPEENCKKGKPKSISVRRKTESRPVLQISLRKRNLVIPKSTNRRSTSISQDEGIVLRPRNVQLASSSRSGTRSAALIRRSKVVLNSKNRKGRDQSQNEPEDINSLDPIHPSTDTSRTDSASNLVKSELDVDAIPKPIRKRVKVRRKFRSGFDYIRKKKRVRKDDPNKPALRKVKIEPVVERKPMSEEQIQVALRNWVINRSHGDTVLHRAARLGYPEVAEYAIKKMKVSPRIADNTGFTPLHEAARRGHVQLSKILLEHGADASCSAKGGVRPLHEAAESNEVEMLRLLLEHGADATIATYANQTALSIVEPDSEAHHLLELHLADVRGLPAPPWKYEGPSKIFDSFTYKDDLAFQSPPSSENDPDEEINVISSEVPTPPLYCFCGEPSSRLWILIADLMNVLNISSEEDIMRRLSASHPDEPSSSQNIPAQTREISVDEFLHKTKAVTFSASLSTLPTSGCMTRLVEYSSKVRALLNEEITTVG